jgi:RNA-directed DNA polymerase
MKRISHLYDKISGVDNLRLADKIASRGKKRQYGVRHHRRNQESNILLLHEMLINKTYKTSAYSTFLVYEPKEREVFRLPYFPDRITHHAIMNVLEPIFYGMYTADTYSCIKGRGIHACSKAIKKALKDKRATLFCLKFDLKKFYPNINHETLKKLLRRKFKDQDLLWLLDEIIDSAPGLPIGNLLSQHLSTFYLTGFDHFVKEVLGVKDYFRYADDIAVFSSSKDQLHKWLAQIREYLQTQLNLQIKKNHQIFPVSARGVDMVGYVHFHECTYLRKGIKQNFARKLKRNPNKQSIASYMGWLEGCNGINLRKKLLYDHNN